MAVGPSLTNYELAVRVLAGRLTRCWGKIQRNRENRDHTDHHTQQLRTVLASHSHHLPPFGFRVGFSEPTAFYVTKRPSGRPFELHFLSIFSRKTILDNRAANGYNKNRRALYMAVSPTSQSARTVDRSGPSGRSTRCWGKIQRNRENRDHTDHHTQQLRTVLASHSHHLPPFGFRVGFSEPTAFYVTKRPSGRPSGRHFYYTANYIFCQFP